MAKATPTPTGLGITRNAAKFTFSWKAAAKNHNGGQGFQWKKGTGSYITVSVTASARSLDITAPVTDFYPYDGKPKIDSISFRVRGKQKKKGKAKTLAMSAWTDPKKYAIAVPPNPTSSCALTNESNPNSSTFSWETTTSDTDSKWFTNCLVQTAFVSDTNEHGKDLPDSVWTNVGSYAGTYSIAREEDTNVIYQPDGIGYTRWFRVCARGPAGDSDYSYGYHVYADPYKSDLKIVEARENATANNTIQCYAKWDTIVKKYSRPTDSTTVQYCLAEPNTGFTLPDGATWSDGPSILDTSGLTDNDDTTTTGRNSNATTFIIDSPLQQNQCLFVRVNSKHDTRETPGDSMIATGLDYTLSEPSIVSISPNTSTHKIAISITNPSAQNIPDSKTAVIFRSPGVEDKVVAIFTGASSSGTVNCPNWGDSDYALGVYAFADTRYIPSTTHNENGVTYTTYDVPSDVLMKSTEDWSTGNVPKAPEIALSAYSEDTIQVTWDWAWDEADISELSWADHSDAWESTEEPSMYRVTNVHAAKWNISGLEAGTEWFVRVRLIKTLEDSEIIGPWSDIKSRRLTSAPDIPNLKLSRYVISKDDDVTASWDYISTDGTDQKLVQICLAEIENDGSITYLEPYIYTAETTEKEHTFVHDLPWRSSGDSYYMCARVESASNNMSEWSQPVKLDIAEPLTASITQTSLDERETNGVTRYYLTELPLTITIEGAGDNAYTNLVIERAGDYHASRPDETDYDGYEGENVAYTTQQGESQISIGVSDLIGALDDTAEYRIIGTVYDSLGQTANVELPFIVEWEHQAGVPSAVVEIDDENYIAKITPVAPESYEEGDVCDIYRISADKPELIVRNGTFGTTYVDPYPAIGQFGGHRIVCKTANGDYITDDGTYAWEDTDADDGDIFETPNTIIDTPDGRIECLYNLNLSNSWQKDFQQTNYLGGSVQGDWNPAVTRTGTINTVSVVAQDQETIKDLKKLADYAGICHVRTKDGSSFSADIQVSEDMSYESYQLVSYSLSITRVDAQELDGLTLQEWQDMQEEEEDELV